MPDMQAPAPGAAPSPAQGPAQAPDQGQGQGGNASQLVAQIYSNMNSLMDLFSQSKSISDENKQALGSIIQTFQQLVQDLAEGPDSGAGAAPMKGMSPIEAGNAKVRQAM